MIYAGTISMDVRIEVCAKSQSEANRLILDKLAGISENFTSLSMRLSKIERRGTRDSQIEAEVQEDNARAIEPSPIPKPLPDAPETAPNKDFELKAPTISNSKLAGYKTFSKFLSQFQFEQGLNDKDLGELLGVSGVCVRNWMDGKSNVRVTLRPEIAKKIQELSGNEYKANDIVALMDRGGVDQVIDLESRNKDIWTILMYYGYPNQRLKAMEELSELLLALARIGILSKRGSEPYANLVEEMADVEVMMAQMRMHYDIDTEEVSRIANEKIDRTLKRMMEDRL